MVNTKRHRESAVEWRRVCSAVTRDSVRINVPHAFLAALTLLFHHVSDAMAGDDRPDHGLAKMRQGREQYRLPFYFVYGKLKRAEGRMSAARRRKAAQTLYRYLALVEEREQRFRAALTGRPRAKQEPVHGG